MIIQSFDWPFLRNSTPLIINTVIDYTTGTCTVSADSTSVTFSAVIAASKTGQYIQFASSNDWYRITAHTAGASTATISPAAISANTTAAYTIRKFHYSLDSTVDRILTIRQSIESPYYLTEQTAEQFRLWENEPAYTGTPELYYMLGKDSSDVWQVGLYPIPNAVINLYVDYIKVATDLSSDSDTSIIPAKWHTSVLLKGAIWQGLEFNGDTRAPRARDEFFLGVQEMKRQYDPSRMKHRVMWPADIHAPTTAYNLPDNYPRVTGNT